MKLIKPIVTTFIILNWLCPLVSGQNEQAQPPPPPAMEQKIDKAMPDPRAMNELSEMQKKNREIGQKINERKKALYRDNDEIKKTQTEIKSLHDKIESILTTDPEYSQLKNEQQILREKMQEQYRSNRPPKDMREMNDKFGGGPRKAKLNKTMDGNTPDDPALPPPQNE